MRVEKSKEEQDQPPLRPIRRESADRWGTAESRLAVVLVADVVEYARHMAEDEAETHARFRAVYTRIVQPAISKHGARIVKNTGDGFLAVFWSATGAVRFAVGFQNAVRALNARHIKRRSLEFRVGVNLGDVILEQDDVFGHNVNIAARLEANADPGSVLVSYSVFASVRDPRLSFEDAGDLFLKNVEESVRAFRVRSGPPIRSTGSRLEGGDQIRG
jgi:class 3 adenylate cyclase